MNIAQEMEIFNNQERSACSGFERNLAFIVGINNYQNGISSLKTAVNDAKKLVEVLRSKHKYQAWICLDSVASLSEINKFLEETLPAQVTEHDRLLFYFAGHGVALNGDDGPVGYLIPQDAKLGDTNSYLPMTKLHSALSKLPCRHFLGILDCCFAGAFRWSSTRDLITSPEVIYQEHYDRFIRDAAWQIITSSASDQKALDNFNLDTERGEVDNHSPFATALLEALEGDADAYPPAKNGQQSGDGVITATELYLYLRDRVEIPTEKQRLRQTPSIWCLNKHDKGEYIFLSPSHELNLPSAPPLDESKNPYRGLNSFEEEHSKIFFGRSKLVEKLQHFVTINPLTVVLGASGSGKSSLVKAGLIPKLKQSTKSTNNQWCILAPIRPGETPFQSLNQALASAGLTTIELQNKQKTIAQSIDIWAKKHPDTKLLIYIDQSEEIITLCPDEDQRKEFFQQILTAINAHRHILRVVLSLRSDFEPQLQDAGLKYVPIVLQLGNTKFKNHWQSGKFQVPMMKREELREAIEKPAQSQVMYFEPHNLVEQLIDEVADMPGALPLLSFALSELFLKYLKRQRDAQFNTGKNIERALTQQDYQELGGVMQSLTQRADEEYQALVQKNPAAEQVIRHVMLRMVAIGGGELARRRVPLSELEYPQEKNSLVKQVIEKFSRARLLVQGQDAEGNPYVEPAHDALVRGWEKLSAWKQKEEENLILQRRLTPAVLEWKNVSREQRVSGFQVKARPVINWLDQKLNPIENYFDKINPQIDSHFARLWYGIPDGQESAIEEATQYLWNGNPYLDVLNKTLNSNDNWLNQVEAEFVKESVVQKQQKQKWRWRISSSVTLIIATTAIIASVQWLSAQERLNSTINALADASQQLFDSNQEFDALLASLRAGKQAKQSTFGVTPETEYKIKTRLQQAAYLVKERNRLEGHQLGVFSVSFNQHGKLASGDADGLIKLWDVTGKELKTFNAHTGPVHVVSFSPDGQLLASASTGDQTVKLWNGATGEKILTFEGYGSDSNGNKGISFSPDGRLLAYAHYDNTIRIVHIERREEIQKLTGHKENVNSVSFSPDGKMLASGSYDKAVKLWDLSTGAAIDAPQPCCPVFAVSFSPDGKTLAIGPDSGRIKLWDLHTNNIDILSSGGERVTNLNFSPDGQILVASGFDKALKIWNVAKRKQITLTGHSAAINSVSFSSDGQLFASASNDSSIKIWDVGKRQEKEANPLLGHDTQVNSVSFSPSGNLLASASRDREQDGKNTKSDIKLWDVKEGKFIDTFRGHSYWVASTTFSRSGNLLASASWDGTVRLWDVASRKVISIVGRHSHWVEDVSFSPNERLVASAGHDKKIKLWDITNPNDPKEIATLPGHKNEVYSISFSPDGRLLASASWDKTIKLWDVTNPNDPKLIKTLEGHKSGVRSIKFSPDGKLLASASDDATIKLWDVATRKEVAPLKGHQLVIRSLSFSPDGKFLASASDDRTVRLWDVRTRKEINVLNGHRTEIYSISFSPDGKILASGSKSGQVILWNYSEVSANFTLDNLLERSCSWLRSYLKNNPNVSKSDSNLCR